VCDGDLAAVMGSNWNVVKVFSVTMAREREQLGERITAWLGAHPELTPVEVSVLQSSDSAFHCLSITIFLTGDPAMMLSQQLPTGPGRGTVSRQVVPRHIQ
jgi:hypothetical protein